MNQCISWILELLFPSKCVFCGSLLEGPGDGMCADCRKHLPWVDKPIERGRFFRSCHSVFYYEGHVPQSVKGLKFRGKSCYASCYGALIAERVKPLRDQIDLVTWVPISAKRKRKRGYDQAFLIASAVSRELELPCVQTLKKLRDNNPQTSCRSGAQRAANVLNCYAAMEPETYKGKGLLVIDDVITSGATLSECCRILTMAGAAKPICATLAATREQ